jgi:hypothetical protein
LADGYLSDDDIGFNTTPTTGDSLEHYLEAPLVPAKNLRHGGLLGYWNGQLAYMPRVAKFALGILSAPGTYSIVLLTLNFSLFDTASSVDVERAFSGGRLTIGHLQHSMGDLTFEAKTAVGSWYNTPLLPSVDTAAAIIEEKLRH